MSAYKASDTDDLEMLNCAPSPEQAQAIQAQAIHRANQALLDDLSFPTFDFACAPNILRCKARWNLVTNQVSSYGDGPVTARCTKVTGHAGNHKFLTPAKTSKDGQ